MEDKIQKKLCMLGASHMALSVVIPNECIGEGSCEEMVETLKDINSMVLETIGKLKQSLAGFGYKWVEFYELKRGEVHPLMHIDENGVLWCTVAGDLHACYSENMLKTACDEVGVAFVGCKDN